MHNLVCDHSGTVGFFASALVLAAFGMKDIVHLRVVAIASNFAFIAYGLALGLMPVLLLHVILLPLNCWRLAEALQVTVPFGRMMPKLTAMRLQIAPGSQSSRV